MVDTPKIDYTPHAILAMMPLMEHRRELGCLHPEDIEIMPGSVRLYAHTDGQELTIEDGITAVYRRSINHVPEQKIATVLEDHYREPKARICSHLKDKKILELRFDLSKDSLLKFTGAMLLNIDRYLAS